MRLVAALVAGLALGGPALAQSTPPPDGYVCTGEARGDRGEAVAVLHYAFQAKHRTEQYAVWEPPQTFSEGKGGFDQPDLLLTVRFNAPTGGSIGPVLLGTLTVSLVSPPRQRAAPGKLAARLGAYTVQYRLGEGPFTPLKLIGDQPFELLPGRAEINGEIALSSPLPNEIEFQVLDTKRKPVATMRYQLSPSQSRDALFAQAWSEALKASANPKACEPTWDTSGDAIIF